MNRNEAITGLAEYALDKELIRPEEKIWAVNSLLDVLLDDAYERGVLTENSVYIGICWIRS